MKIKTYNRRKSLSLFLASSNFFERTLICEMDRKKDRTSLVFWSKISASKIKFTSCNLFRITNKELVKSVQT